ncbi:MAG: toprim domain-containing protein [Zoogloeaceae bacterium]|nr:toprim domain-containing protein [Zoogloeaceae bacterium]
MSAAMPERAGEGLFERVKEAVDLHDLAGRLGLERKGGKGNYKSPRHPDKSPSLSITPNARGWKDWSTEAGGSCIDLVMYARPEVTTPNDAARLLAGWYGIALPATGAAAGAAARRPPRSNAEIIAGRALANAQANPAPVLAYLAGRGIDEAVARAAIQHRALGWNDWVSPKIAPGEVGHGGAAAVFIVRALDGRAVVAADMRYADPGKNGGCKTQCQGIREGYPWTSDFERLKAAHTVYVVESPINALSVECCPLPAGAAVLALRGTGNADKLDLAFLKGRRVVLALDQADPVTVTPVGARRRAGLAAAWRLLDRLIASDVAASMVDMQDWEEGEDINDVLRAQGADELWLRLRKRDAWLIPGMPGGGDRETLEGRRRVFLPEHDYRVYWRYRTREDFTQYVTEFKEEGEGKIETLGDVCSFRLASLSRLRVQGHIATFTGTADTQAETVFALSAQTPRHGANLARRVFNDQTLYSLDYHRTTFGAIFHPMLYQRMVNIMERTADLSARDAVNFIGLAWRAGKLAALEGRDCYLQDPDKQCLYHNMVFPRGTQQAAREVIAAYQATFQHNAALIALVWALGAHLKCVIGFYPHFKMQADKGAGKSILTEAMQRTLGFQMLSGQMLKTDHRRRASVSYTSHPVGWDELSKQSKTVLAEADTLLQSTYRFDFTRVGAALTPYLMCAPVLLAGEEVDFASLQSKLCVTTLSVKKQGPILPRDLPAFPVWQWLLFLERTGPERIRQTHQRRIADCAQGCRAGQNDAITKRMMENYAAILAAWDLLTEFAGISPDCGGFVDDLTVEMNGHIGETDGMRLPWVWIMEILLSEIESDQFKHPYTWDTVTPQPRNTSTNAPPMGYTAGAGEAAANAAGAPHVALLLRPAHVMDHLSTAPHLRAKFDALPIKSGRVFKNQLMSSGVVVGEELERTIRGHRTAHLVAISLERIERLGLYATPKLLT